MGLFSPITNQNILEYNPPLTVFTSAWKVSCQTSKFYKKYLEVLMDRARSFGADFSELQAVMLAAAELLAVGGPVAALVVPGLRCSTPIRNLVLSKGWSLSRTVDSPLDCTSLVRFHPMLVVPRTRSKLYGVQYLFRIVATLRRIWPISWFFHTQFS